MRVPVFTLTLVLLASVTPTKAECIKPGRWWIEESSAELVFSGTVDKIARTAELGFRASVTVDRAWKGAVDQSIDLFVWELAAERPPIAVGQRYVFALSRMHPTTHAKEREGAGVPADASALTPIMCGAEPYADAERSGLVRDFGPGYAPK